MTVDTAALEQLRKRFEALRGCGLIKLLVIEQTGGPKRDELPPSCQPFTSACDTITTCYGTAAGTGQRVYAFRWLGRPEAVEEVLSAIQAAAQLLQVPLAQAGLIHPADYVPPRDSAQRCAWAVAMLTAAERGQLVCDAMPAEGWKHWSGDVAMCTRTVDFYRSQAHLHRVDPVAVLAQAMDTSSRYVVLANVAECCIGLLRVLASMKPAQAKVAKPPRPKKPFPNITECIKHIHSTGGGRERIAACGTLGEVCDFIKQEYSGQPATPPLVKEGWPKEIPYPFTKQKKPRRTVGTASRLGEHFDIEGFQERSPQPSPRVAASLKCASCGDPIRNADDCLQHEGKLYCRVCGEEKAHGVMPPLR